MLVECSKTEHDRRNWLSWVFTGLALVVILWQGGKLDKAWKDEAVAEAAAKSERLRAEMIVVSTPNAVVMCGSDYKITFANPAAEQLFGWTYEELLGKDTSLLVPEKYREAHKKAMSLAKDRASTMAGDWAIRKDLHAEGLRRDGSTVLLDFSIRTIRYAGKVEFVTSMIPLDVPKPKEEVVPLPDLEQRIQEAETRAEERMQKE